MTASVANVREMDRRATEEYGIPSLLLMENAGRALADAALSAGPGRVVVVCGGGNNGGDGFVAARFLHNAGRDVSLLLAKPDEEILRRGGDPAVNLAITRKMGIRNGALSGTGLVVDALFGTGLDREVLPPHRDTIDEMNAAGVPVVSADVPSGLHAETGAVLGSAVRATVTVTFAAIKRGLLVEGAKEYVGELKLADIGIPRELVRELSD